MPAEVLKIETPPDFERAVSRATELLRRSEVVAVPTETVYGLAANAFDVNAVRRIYEVKGRPDANPIIVHVASMEMARSCVRSWPAKANLLAAAFWPGPLTVVLPKSSALPAIVTAGGDTVGIRWPAHPFMQALIRRCGFPLGAPSANLSNALSPTSAEHVLATLREKIPLVIDAGAANVGIESTVLDLTVTPAKILRSGMISRSQIEAVLQEKAVLGEEAGGVLKSPGLLRKHYAPRARLMVTRWRSEAELRSIAGKSGFAPREISVIAHERIPQSDAFGRVAVIPHDAEAYARALYGELHHCDQSGSRLILVEDVPSGDEWQGIRDRLKRASAAD